MIEYFRYVRYEDVPTFEAKGWVVDVPLGPTGAHHFYACLMRWAGEGEPK